MLRHSSQIITLAIKNWTRADWEIMAKDNKCTVDEVKDYFHQCLKDGKVVLPIGRCEGFDYTTGCPGHNFKEGTK